MLLPIIALTIPISLAQNRHKTSVASAHCHVNMPKLRYESLTNKIPFKYKNIETQKVVRVVYLTKMINFLNKLQKQFQSHAILIASSLCMK